MEIIKASHSNAVIVALLARITFTETFGHYFRDKTDLENYLSLTFNVQKLKNSLTKPNNVYWLAFIDGLPVGYAKLKLKSPSPLIKEQDVCQLQKIYVLKDFLSKKVGLTLQNVLLEEAKSKASKIWLSVLKENLRAIRFYEKNGFKKIGDHDFQIGKEHFEFQAMSKSLL
ncbi:GNAT family N-acetyltransferase [Flagellimonas sp. S3867]|uniref:GNAT family N-acetyltransferase n=1 Tax=Flagellimonas sp. S3867 TaxID=2768063 RepID=UPI0016871F12|nr:GNAT family N-acetyltransferase [Flagellimonas sp. S3867]